MATTVRVTIQQFLAAPASKPYRELMDGEVFEKPMPNALHGGLAARLIFLLTLHQQQNDTFHVCTEMRHADAATDWVFLPDISVLLKSQSVASLSELTDPVLFPPDFAFEVLSPGDRAGTLSRRAEAYRRAGTTLLWIVDPVAESIIVSRRGEEQFEASSERPLNAAPVLPEFEVDIPGLFAFLHAK